MPVMSQKTNGIHRVDGRKNTIATVVQQVDLCCSSSQFTHNNARFASEVAVVDLNSSKCRQLPCKTFVSVGTCPFGERCVFLHDPRLISSATHSITRQKNKEDNVVDTFFWPAGLSGDGASKNLEHNFHQYSVPAPQNDRYKLHDQALYSLWMHHVEFCRANSKAQKSSQSGPCKVPVCEEVSTNPFTSRERLPVFQLLSRSNGQESKPVRQVAVKVAVKQTDELLQLKLDNANALKKLEALQKAAQMQQQATVRVPPPVKVAKKVSAPRAAARSPTSTVASAVESAFKVEYASSSSGHTSCGSGGEEDDDVSSLSSEDSAGCSEMERRRRKALSIVSKSEAIQMAGKAAFHAQTLYYQEQQQRYSAYY